MLRKRDEIRDRLVDARLLWQNGRKNGAFIQALIALAGLASLRYPKKTAPKVYFDKMREYHPNQASQIAASEKKQKRNRLSDGRSPIRRPQIRWVSPRIVSPPSLRFLATFGGFDSLVPFRFQIAHQNRAHACPELDSAEGVTILHDVPLAVDDA